MSVPVCVCAYPCSSIKPRPLPPIISVPHLKNMEYAADLSTLFDFGGIVGGVIAGVVSDKTNSPALICEVMFVLAAPLVSGV